MVANLPYNITKDCLLRMLPMGGTLSHLYFMLQVGGVQRVCGHVCGHVWGRGLAGVQLKGRQREGPPIPKKRQENLPATLPSLSARCHCCLSSCTLLSILC